jgi:hypothetical protein
MKQAVSRAIYLRGFFYYMLHDASYLAYFLTLKMEATCSSETPVDFQQNKRRHISEGKIHYLKLVVPSFKFRHLNCSPHEIKCSEFRAEQLNEEEIPYNLISCVWRWRKPCFVVV